MELDQILYHRKKLCDRILDAVRVFHKETGVSVDRIELETTDLITKLGDAVDVKGVRVHVVLPGNRF